LRNTDLLAECRRRADVDLPSAADDEGEMLREINMGTFLVVLVILNLIGLSIAAFIIMRRK
jgi:hypothetical protein